MSWIKRIGFVLLGVTSIGEVANPWSVIGITVGAFIGLLIGWFSTLFLRMMIALLNPSIKKNQPKKTIKKAVNRGMMFVLPFGIMSAAAFYGLMWNVGGVFLSISLMTAGVMATTEVESITGKSNLRTSIAATLVVGVFAFGWTISLPFIRLFPIYLNGGLDLLMDLIRGSGVSL